MTLVKTFDEFKKPPVIDEARTVGKISVANPKAGEIKRWNVVLRSGDEGAVDQANPSNTILRELSQDPDFKNWWKSYDALSVTTDKKQIPNHNLLAIIDLGVQNKTNLIGQNVYKAQVAFLPYATGQLHTGEVAGMWVTYDVTKVPHRASATVEGSDVELVAWNSQDLPDLRVTNDNKRIEAKDKTTGGNIPANLVNPAYVEKNGAKGGVATVSTTTAASSTTAAGSTTTARSTTAAGSTTTATANTSVGLKATQTFDQKIQDLQKKIIASGNAEAAKAINDKGGAIGKYGSGTAKAIAILVGTPTVPVTEITPEIAAKLDAALKNVTPEQIAAVKAPAATQAATTAKPAEKAAASAKVTTAGGTTYEII
jgi:hypothetical protein